jgi:VRR-NUC domain
MRESAIENYLVTGVEALGGECPKWASPGRIGPPDRIVLMPGAKIVFIELKAPGGVLKPWQVRYHEMLRELGFRVEVLWDCVGVDEFLCSL